MKKLLLVALMLICVQGQAQVLFLNDATVTVPGAQRGGINLGSLTSFDSGQMFKNLLRGQNWNFEPNELHQIFALTKAGTATTFANTNNYSLFTANSMAGATFQIVDTQSGGSELGCRGTVASNTTGNGSTVASVYTISAATNQGQAGCSAPFSIGDIVLVYQNQFPTTASCWQSSNACGMTGTVTNSGKLTTDSTSAWDGQQSLVLDVRAKAKATADARLYFDNNLLDIFVLLNGTYNVTGYVRMYAGAVTPLQISVSTTSGLCNGSVAAPTSTWTPFTVTCNFSETSQTTPENHWVDFTAAGSGGLGAVEIDDVSFQKTSGQDSTNPTVFRDETVAALRALCATNTPGPSCLVRNWTNQNGESTANWTADAGEAAMTSAGPSWTQTGEITPQLQEYLNLVQLVGGQPYLVFPCTATTQDAQNFVDYMSGTDTSSGYAQLRSSQGQSAPWVGPGGVFSTMWVSFCDEAWNGSSFIGQGLPFRSTAGSQYYYDYANRTKDIYSAMRSDANFSPNMQLGFNLQMLDNSKEALPASLQMLANAGGAADYMELAPYTQNTVARWQTDAVLWQSAMEEPWGNVHDPNSSSTFYQNVQLVKGIHLCGPSGTAACAVTVYEEANSTLGTCGVGGQAACSAPAVAAIDQTHEDYITAGAGEGVIAPLQMLLNQQQMGITAQNYFALAGYENTTLSGSLATYGKLWGCTVDMGGSTSQLNGEEYSFRPACLGLEIANQSIIGPEYSAVFSSGLPKYNWAGDAYNGPTDALSNVPYIYAFCFEAQLSGAARSCVFVNTSLTSAYTVTFAGPGAPSGSCTMRQFAPGAIDDLNESLSGTATNATSASVSTSTSTNACASALVLPVNSVTALDFVATNMAVSPTPTFFPAGGTYSTTQTVTISDAAAGATIYYTTDGSTPTEGSLIYSGPLSVNSSEMLNAIAVVSGDSSSGIGTVSYTIVPPAAPTFSPAPASYSSSQTVTISDAAGDATIYYTTDGSMPTPASSVYSGPLVVGVTETLKAIAVESGDLESGVGTAIYTINATAPLINFSSGFTSTGLNLFRTTITNGALQLTDGGVGESGFAWYKTPVNVQAFNTDFTFQLTNATANGFTFAMQNASAGIYALGSSGSGLGYSGIGTSVAVKFDLYNSAGEGSDSTGFYTNGATPTVPFVDMSSSAVDLHSGDLMHANLVYDGATLTLNLTDVVTNASFSTSSAINIPSTVGGKTAYVGFTASTGALTAVQDLYSWSYTPAAFAPIFSLAPGAYTSVQTVSITDASPGAVLYYTTDGTAPTTASSVYSSPLTINTTETLNAIAVVSGLAASAVQTATYAINFPAAAAPVFSVNSGSYAGSQTVSLSDTTVGSSIYYTTDGSVPTSASLFYSSPILVSASETVNAIAFAVNYSNSAVVTAVYTINGSVNPVSFLPVAGVYAGAQTVTLNDSTAGSSIYYTLDGSLPTTSSTIYSGPILVSATETINAIAIAANYTNSTVSVASYTINGAAARPGFSPPGGVYGGAQTVSITDATAGSSIYYTTDGSIPTASSTLYSGPVVVAVSQTLTAIALAQNYSSSAVATAAYTIYGSPVGNLEQAADATTGSTTIPTNDTLFISGWAADPIDGSPLANVKVYIDGVFAATPTLGISRPDVAAYTANPAYASSGFLLYYPASSLNVGSHSVTVVAVNGGGVAATLGNLTINVIAVYPAPVGNLEFAADAATGATTIPNIDTLQVSGWAADPTDGSPLSIVKILIDGNSVGTPTLGGARPDVAAYYNNPSYANSGFTFTCNANLLGAGTHTVTVALTNTHGVITTLGPNTINVAVNYAAPVGNLEQAADQATGSTTIPSTDTLFLSGWVADPLDGSPMTNVKVSIDGNIIGTPTLGGARPDVAAYYNNPGYANSGFTFAISAASFSAGSHAVTVTATNTHSVTTTLGPTTINVTTAYAAPQGNLESAGDAANGSNTIPTTDTLQLSGWAADPVDGSPMTNVTVLIDGNSVGAPTLNLPRPDVASYYNNPAYANSGYVFTYSANLLSPGVHLITVMATNAHSIATTFGPKSVTITAANRPPVGALDQAGDANTGSSSVSQQSGTLYVGGWAADYQDNGPAAQVQVLIDGIAVGAATLGLPRPDVASYYNNPAWLNTGYQLYLPAAGLQPGTHVVTAVATDSLGLATNSNALTITITP